MKTINFGDFHPASASTEGARFIRDNGGEPSEAAPTWENAFVGAGQEVHDSIRTRVEEVATELWALSHSLFTDPEIGFDEHRSVARVADLLRRHGYHPIVGTRGLSTSLELRVGKESGGPVVAIMAEYDALPEIGHGCGHNMICAGAVGAFLGVAPVVEALGGSVILYGTPAEENGSGKETMAQHGALDAVDAAMMVHPFAGVSRTCTDYLGLREANVTFEGRTAHASATPYMGVNALDAAVTAYNSIAMARQQLVPSDRIHAIINSGGKTPNVIPDQTEMVLNVRSATTDGLLELSKKVERIIEGASRTTGCTAQLVWDHLPPCLPVRTNQTLVETFAHHFTSSGQQIWGPPERSAGSAASTDMGNISVRVPAIHPMIAITSQALSLHTRAFAEIAAGSVSDQMIVASAIAMACATADVIADGNLLEAIKDEFTATGGVPDSLREIVGSGGK